MKNQTSIDIILSFPGTVSSFVRSRYEKAQQEGINISRYDILKEIIEKYKKDGSLPDWKFY